MPTSKPRSNNGLVLLVAVIGLVFGSAGPAAASHLTIQGGGNGDAPGDEWGPNVNLVCSDVNNVFAGKQFATTYYLITENNFTVVLRENGMPIVHYEGPISMNLQHGDMLAAPQGARAGTCNEDNHEEIVVPGPVPLTRATAQGKPSSGAINCQSRDTVPGTYTRLESNVLFDFDVSCTVQGNSSGLTATRYVWTTFSMAGTQNTSGYLRILNTSIAVSGNGHV